MKSFSDPNYRLPQIQALMSFDIMDTGTTQPMGVRGVDTETGTRGQYVVKFHNANRMTPKSSCREFLGAWMAKELGIKVVEPVLINISPEFVNTLKGKNGFRAAQQSIGPNFGSVYEAGFTILPVRNFRLDKEFIDLARMIFMFDMLISNADRGAGKPNVLGNGQDILLLDHELAFSFMDLLSLSRNKTPWIIGFSEAEMYKSHYFYPILKDEEHEFTEQVERLDCFTNSLFWSKVSETLPQGWQYNELTEIQTHVTSIVNNKYVFAEQLTKILSK